MLFGIIKVSGAKFPAQELALNNELLKVNLFQNTDGKWLQCSMVERPLENPFSQHSVQNDSALFIGRFGPHFYNIDYKAKG